MRVSTAPRSTENEFELAVLRGRAELVNEDGRTSLRAGERAFARVNAAPSYAYVFNSASADAFDRWSEGRRSERLGLSSQYLPEEVRAYSASFDRNGSWGYDASYGYVWYPRVDVGWRPYHYGRWVPYRHYGVSWVSAHAWGWPTHHYGRWGFNTGVWFWIPGRTWGPAWVSWAYAPGYVSWCPLGWNNRAVVQFGYSPGYRGYDHWRAWTVVPHRAFGSSYVHRTVVTSNHIDTRTRGAFVQRDRAPDVVGYAVPRGSVGAAPIRVAGTAASRSTASPMLSNRGAGALDSTRSSTPSRAVARDEAVRERTLPSRSVVRSSQSGTADSPAQTDSRNVTRAVPRTQDRPVYQPENRAVERSRPRSAESPIRPADSISSPLSSVPGRSNDLPTYRREDGYRARPETATPTDRYAVPRGDFRRPAVSEPRSGESNRPAVSEPRRGESNRPGRQRRMPLRRPMGHRAPRRSRRPPAGPTEDLPAPPRARARVAARHPAARPSQDLAAAVSNAVMARVVVRIARSAGLIALFLIAAILGVASGVIFAYTDDIAKVSELDDYTPSTISRIYGSGGEIVGEFAIQRREVIPYEAISPRLRQAILAAEDADFEKHPGISIPHIAVTLVKDIIKRKKAGGASTLTQQLARKLFLTDEKTWERKIREALLAIRIEKRYTKREIFTMYANQMYFGHGVYGVEAASRLYFGKSAKDLDVPEAALIAGILQGNVRQSPFVNMEAAIRRRNYTLGRMAEVGYIGAQAAEAFKKMPIVLRGEPSHASIAPYFVEDIRKELEQQVRREAVVRKWPVDPDRPRRAAPGGGEPVARRRAAADRQGARLASGTAQRRRGGPQGRRVPPREVGPSDA